ELEVLHRIGDEYLRAIEPRIRQGAVQHAAGRPDEWLAGDVLVVSRLLADQHQRRRSQSLAGDDLGGIAIERTARALCFGLAKLAQGSDLGAVRIEQTHGAPRRSDAISKTIVCARCSCRRLAEGGPQKRAGYTAAHGSRERGGS